MKKESFLVTSSVTDANHIKVLLEGQLVIKNARAIKKELLFALTRAKPLEFVFRNIIKIDLAVLQLLIALQKSAVKLGKNLSFDFELTEDIKSVMEHSGFAEIFIGNFKNAE